MPIIGIGASSILANLPSTAVDYGAYDVLASVVLSSNTPTVTFAGIPSGYRHLEISGIARGTRNGTYDRIDMRFNNDSAANYSRHLILSDWGVNPPQSYGYPSQTFVAVAYVAGATSVSNTFGGFTLSIMDYADPTKYKTTKGMGGATNNGTGAYVSVTSGSYMSFNPITSITLGPIEEGSSLTAFSSISLYGVK